MQKIIWFCLNLRQLSFAIEKKSTDTHTDTFRKTTFFHVLSVAESESAIISNTIFFAVAILPFLKEYGSKNKGNILLKIFMCNWHTQWVRVTLNAACKPVSYTHLFPSTDLHQKQKVLSTLHIRAVCRKLFDFVWICGCYRLP